jgi:hypothetical protein
MTKEIISIFNFYVATPTYVVYISELIDIPGHGGDRKTCKVMT